MHASKYVFTKYITSCIQQKGSTSPSTYRIYAFMISANTFFVVKNEPAGPTI